MIGMFADKEARKGIIESLLMEKTREISDIVRAYAPDSNAFGIHISFGLNGAARVNINNDYWESKHPIRITSVPLDWKP